MTSLFVYDCFFLLSFGTFAIGGGWHSLLLLSPITYVPHRLYGSVGAGRHERWIIKRNTTMLGVVAACCMLVAIASSRAKTQRAKHTHYLQRAIWDSVLATQWRATASHRISRVYQGVTYVRSTGNSAERHRSRWRDDGCGAYRLLDRLWL